MVNQRSNSGNVNTSVYKNSPSPQTGHGISCHRSLSIPSINIIKQDIFMFSWGIARDQMHEMG